MTEYEQKVTAELSGIRDLLSQILDSISDAPRDDQVAVDEVKAAVDAVGETIARWTNWPYLEEIRRS